jgi:aminoglycoside phosphotransferase (APT) family kinase protein
MAFIAMFDRPHELAAVLSEGLSWLWNSSVQVDGVRRFHGGTARETWGLVAHFPADDLRGPLPLVLRRDSGSVASPAAREAEFHAISRAYAAGLPVPEPLHLDPDGALFGAPGFLMREVRGGRAPSLFEDAPYGDTGEALGIALWRTLGALHRLKPDARDRTAMPVMDVTSRLQYFASMIHARAAQPEPVAEAALRWLSARIPPSSGPLALVHGDFRSGNFLVDSAGDLLAILDWELAHIGDPMEDLAWAMDPLWSHGRRDLASATVPPDQMFAIWEQASGRKVARDSLDWWRMFSGVKGLALWIATASEVQDHRTVDPVMTFSGLYSYRFHNAEVARMLMDMAA